MSACSRRRPSATPRISNGELLPASSAATLIARAADVLPRPVSRPSAVISYAAEFPSAGSSTRRCRWDEPSSACAGPRRDLASNDLRDHFVLLLLFFLQHFDFFRAEVRLHPVRL